MGTGSHSDNPLYPPPRPNEGFVGRYRPHLESNCSLNDTVTLEQNKTSGGTSSFSPQKNSFQNPQSSLKADISISHVPKPAKQHQGYCCRHLSLFCLFVCMSVCTDTWCTGLPPHPDDGLAVRAPSSLVLGKSVLHAVPAALQRALQDDHVLQSTVHSLQKHAYV